MNTITTISLKNLYLSTDMMTAEQISDFVNEKITDNVPRKTSDLSNDQFYLSSETSSSSQLSDEFIKYQPKGDYLSSSQDYTAFEVFPTLNAILSGTESNVELIYPEYYVTEYGIWEVDDICKIADTQKIYTCIKAINKNVEMKPGTTSGWETYWVEGNSHFSKYHYVYTEEVPANATLSLEFYTTSKSKEENDIVISWGDGTQTIVSKDSITWISSSDNQNIIRVSHVYTEQKKFIVKIYGKDYFMVRNEDHENNIISRIFDNDLPVASCVKNVSSLCNGSKRILELNIPYEYNFKNITNFTALFYNCVNLRDAYVSNGVLDRPHQSLRTIFYNCKNLDANIKNIQNIFKFWAEDGCLLNVFYECRKIYGNIDPKIFWENPMGKGYNSYPYLVNLTFSTCSDQIRAQVPESWGGTKVEDWYEIFSYYEPGMLKNDGTVVGTESVGYVTDYHEVVPYSTIKVDARYYYSGFAYAFYDENKNFINTYPDKSSTTPLPAKILEKESVEIPKSVRYIRVAYVKNKEVVYPRIYEFGTTGKINSVSDPKLEYVKDSVTVSNKKAAYRSEDLKFGYISKSGVVYTSLSSDPYRVTDCIEIEKYNKIIVEKTYMESKWGNTVAAVYDENNNFLSSYYNDTSYSGILENLVFKKEDLLKDNPTAKYIRICTMRKVYFSILLMFNSFEYNENIYTDNYLYGKTYLALGDSFTRGSPSECSKYDYDYDSYDTYPLFIAKRNKMKLLNKAVDGMGIFNPNLTDDKCLARSINTLSNEISSADYITFMFGGNESNANIGTKEDNDTNSTFGSWNVILSAVYIYNPDVKVGFIIGDYSYDPNSRTQYNAQLSVAKWWGIPYLDLNNDINVPLMISKSGKFDTETNPWIVSIKNSIFAIDYPNNIHPNTLGQEYKSTIIEKYMRGL